MRREITVTYTVTNLSAGTYHIYVGADAGANRGNSNWLADQAVAL